MPAPTSRGFAATGTGDVACRFWQSDGTGAGTRCAYDSTSLALGPVADAAIAAGGALVLAAVDHLAGDGDELRVLFNGRPVTIAGGDIAPGARGSQPQQLLVHGDTVYFHADDGIGGREPWRLDIGDLDRVFRDGFEGGVR